MLTHFDDCAGIGGFALAAEWAGGITTIAAREIDPYARRVYALRFPHVRLYGDVRGPVPDESPDLYTCGFPCQPVSVAGKRLGEKDPRWLWPDIARTIRLLRPRWMLLENVPGLLFRGMGTVFGDLAACGYDAEWDCIPASAVGAPHRRDRAWIVAYPEILRVGRIKPSIREEDDGQNRKMRWKPKWSGASVLDMADAESKGLAYGVSHSGSSKEGIAGFEQSGWWTTEPAVGRVAHGVPHRVDRLRCLGNAIVPQIAYWILRRIVEADNERMLELP